MRSRGTGVSWRSLLSLWSNLTWNQSVFNCEAAFSPVVGALLPAVLGVGALSAPLRVPLVFLLGGLAWWFCSVQILRYLIPWLGTWSLLTAVVLDRLAAALVPVRRPSSAMMVTVLGCTALLAPGWWYAYGEVAWQWPPPVKRRQRDAYLEERRPTYAAYKTLNDAHGRDYRLYAIYDGSMAYFADGTFMGEWWGVARYERITSRIHDGPALYRELRLLGADHLLVPKGTWFGSPPQDTFFRSRARLILETPAYWLFELARDDSPDP